LLAQQAEDAEGDVAVVGTHDLDAATVRFQDGGVVEADAIGLSQPRLLVRIHGADVEPWVFATQDLDQRLGPPPVLVGRVVEVRELDVLRERADDGLRLRRGREGALPGEVQVGVMGGEGEVG